MDKILVIGAYKLAKEVKSFVERYNLYEIIGYSVNEKYITSDVFEGKPIYPLEYIENYVDINTKVFVGISWGNRLNQVRKDIYMELKKKGYSFANLIAPQAVILTDNIGEGNWFHEYCFIGHDASIGNNNEFMGFSSVGHYSCVGSHNHFSKCSVGGATQIGDCNFVGMQSIIYNRICVGDKNLIGAGTIIKRNLGNYNIVVAKESSAVQLKEKQIELVILTEGKNFLR